MSKSMTALTLIIGILLCCICGYAWGLLGANINAQTQYDFVASTIGAIHEVDPELESTVMTVLKEGDTKYLETGDLILRTYSYDSRSFREGFFWPIAILAAVTLLLFFFVFFFIDFYRRYRYSRRIRGLTAFLAKANKGEESVLALGHEDMFSFLEDEAYKTVTEQRQARESAVRERTALAENLANIAHQIKTPITSMFLMTGLLEETADKESALYLQKLNRQLARLDQMVASLLTLSRLDAGTLTFAKMPVDVVTMLDSAVEPIETTLQEKNITVAIAREPASSYLGDIGWSAEAVLNIVRNCAQHAPDQSSVTLTHSETPLYTEIVVEDEGPGFFEEDLPHAFQRFYRGTNAKDDSVGVGLALAKAIVEAQDGIITAGNRAEKGARFTIKFYK